MTDYIKMLRKRFVTDAEQKKLRQPALEPYALAQEWHERGLPDHRRAWNGFRLYFGGRSPMYGRMRRSQ